MLKNTISFPSKISPNTYCKECYLGECLYGFAIMVTYDLTYLREHKGSCAKNFYLEENKSFPAGVAINWCKTKNKNYYMNTWRDSSLQFNKNYKCDWIKNIKFPTKDEEFNCLVFEV